MCLRYSVLITGLHVDVVHLVYNNTTNFVCLVFFPEMPITDLNQVIEECYWKLCVL